MRRHVVHLSKAVLTAIFFLISLTAAAQQQPRRQIIVSIPDRKLALLEDGDVLKVYDVAVGATNSPSPAGEFTIVNRLENPTYYRPGVVIEPGTSNPLGTRWMGLSQKGFGIHGTNQPQSIGKAASHGCIRMAQKDLEELFTLVHVGDTVSIRAERDDEVAAIFSSDDDDDDTETVLAEMTDDDTTAAEPTSEPAHKF
jgi:lipoprotein-anchoring transpeptidase ErfK/SrfK